MTNKTSQTIKEGNLVNIRNINKCLKYIDEAEHRTVFREIVKDLDVRVKLIGYGQMDWDDGHSRHIYRVTIKRNGKQASIRFGQSLVNTEQGIEPDLYDILTVIGSEQSIYINTSSFEEYCDELGFDVTDIKTALRSYKKLQSQGKKIAQIFKEEEIWSLPH